jgi:hypothetical protein
LLSAAQNPILLLGWNVTLIAPAPVIVPVGQVGLSPLVLELTLPDLGRSVQGVDLYMQGLFVAGAAGYLATGSHLSALSLTSPGNLGADCNGNGISDVWETIRGLRGTAALFVSPAAGRRSSGARSSATPPRSAAASW